MIIGNKELRSLSWYGLKPRLKSLLGLPLLNPLLLGFARTFLSPARRARVPVGKDVVTYRMSNGGHLTLNSPMKCDVARDIYWGQGRREWASECHAIDCAEALAGSADLFLDIGAYSGLFSLVVGQANPGIRVFAYEIVPENYLLLVENVITNRLNRTVSPQLLGIADQPGEIRMPLKTQQSQLPSSLSLSSSFPEGLSVPLARLDDLFGDFSGKAFFKIDVEGFEPGVLTGGREFLARIRPDMICEVLESADTSAALHEQLDPLQYSYYQFTDAGLVRRERIKPSRDGRDWLLTVKPLAELRSALPKLSVD
ncbi:FkbM family methyltransferase [Arenimonas oryziterrae]|uniref:Methyltransferase FkbM domain-containing protein n=1 Tax=Arenimonas oryziterrae DSM 21050 = YC6267 TaxID=1121015 RepID=A0A091BL63_9GAMM|nr:FkbM family methyltransferase [Arenimonas oryziterrae]KFN45075.1 hypothetical protein N789_03370 [Arenimonas oryziterrae DSM 21050 = YC6267]